MRFMHFLLVRNLAHHCIPCQLPSSDTVLPQIAATVFAADVRNAICLIKPASVAVMSDKHLQRCQWPLARTLHAVRTSTQPRDDMECRATLAACSPVPQLV